MESSSDQLPIILEKKSSSEIPRLIDQNKELPIDSLSRTIKEIEQLINSIPINEENTSIIEALKQKIILGQSQLSQIQKFNSEKESQISNNQNSKMDLMLNKIDIILDIMNSKKIEEPNSDEIKEKIYENGDKYLGQFKNGKKHGKGKMFYSDKSYYDGDWFNDLKMGHGQLTLANGDKYEGTFKNNLMEGYGNYFYKNGRIYEGQFINGFMEGKGIYKFTTGNQYIGDFQKGLFNGKGTYLYTNGDRFEGMYQKGKKNGSGIYYFKTGEKYKGEWIRDERNGEGVLIHKNGKEEKQYFENGKQRNIKSTKTIKK